MDDFDNYITTMTFTHGGINLDSFGNLLIGACSVERHEGKIHHIIKVNSPYDLSEVWKTYASAIKFFKKVKDIKFK